MKLKYNILLGAVLLFAASCSKEIGATKMPAFDVQTDATTYQVGKAITFNISGGDADYITFYSGTPLNEYNYRDGHVVDASGALLSFSTAVTLGAQANQLAVMASTNFDGTYTYDKVKAATWTDITSRFVLGTDGTAKASTEQDISDLLVPGKPIYIGFKYLTKPQAVNGLARSWTVTALLVNSKQKLGTAVLKVTDQTFAGIKLVDQDPVNTPSRSSLGTGLNLYGNLYKQATDEIFDPNNPIFDPKNPKYDPKSTLYQPLAVRPTFVPFDPTSPYNDPTRENWGITKGLTTDKIDLGIDKGTPIKTVTEAVKTTHSYTFGTPGTYTVTFVAKNMTIDETKEVVKQLTLTITP
jgi:hypothetical protein